MKTQNILLNPILYKNKMWDYENEWRYISTNNTFNKTKGEFIYLKDAIKSIYLGCKSSKYKSEINEIKKWAKDNGKNVYIMYPAQARYKLLRRKL